MSTCHVCHIPCICRSEFGASISFRPGSDAVGGALSLFPSPGSRDAGRSRYWPRLTQRSCRPHPLFRPGSTPGVSQDLSQHAPGPFFPPICIGENFHREDGNLGGAPFPCGGNLGEGKGEEVEPGAPPTLSPGGWLGQGMPSVPRERLRLEGKVSSLGQNPVLAPGLFISLPLSS